MGPGYVWVLSMHFIKVVIHPSSELATMASFTSVRSLLAVLCTTSQLIFTSSQQTVSLNFIVFLIICFILKIVCWKIQVFILFSYYSPTSNFMISNHIFSATRRNAFQNVPSYKVITTILKIRRVYVFKAKCSNMQDRIVPNRHGFFKNTYNESEIMPCVY